MHLDLQLSHLLFTEAVSDMMKTVYDHWLKNKIFFVVDVCQNLLVYFVFPCVCVCFGFFRLCVHNMNVIL